MPAKDRDGYPDGVTCWVDATVKDPKAATEFYGGLFGWEFEDTMPPKQPGHYFIGRLRGLDVAGIGSLPNGGTSPSAWNTYIWADSADDAAAKVKDAGGAVLMEPFDMFEAGRMAVAADPQGAAFNLWEAGSHKGAQVVNEPGSWVFSELATSDPEAAIAFYEKVFGWEGEFQEGYSFFRKPGYGDYLEREVFPEIRAEQAAQETPPGFEDVTASLMSLDGMPEGTPPNWGVTFATDNADAAAAKAAELGGSVMVEPFDAPPVRTAVISDPQGAVFSVSKYTPPSE